MLRPNVLTLLLFLPVVFSATELPAEEVTTLIVKASEELQLKAEPELETLIAVDGGLMTVVETSFSAPNEAGEHFLAIASRDRLGRLSPIRWQRLLVDAEIPVVMVTTEPPSVEHEGTRWVSGGTLALARAEDDLAGIARLTLTAGEAQEAMEEAGAQRTAQAQLTLPREGRLAVRGRAVDAVGWSSEEAVLEVSIDSTPPSGALRVEGPQVSSTSGLVISPKARVVADIADAESGLADWTAHLDGSPVASPDAWEGPWTAGEHRVLATARDRVGNEGSIGPLAFVVDDAPPEISIQIENRGWNDQEGKTWYIAPVSVRASAVDQPAGLARFEASTDGSTFSAWNGEQAIDGDRLTLRASDRLGQERIEVVHLNVDREAPIIALRGPDSQVIDPGSKIVLIRDQALTVEVRDDQTGLASAVHRLNQHRETVLPELIRFRDRGDFDLEIRAVDNAGLETRSIWKIRVNRAPKGD